MSGFLPAQHVWYVKQLDVGDAKTAAASEPHVFYLSVRLTGREGATVEVSNRWKSASLPNPPAEINGWERERLPGSSTWYTIFQDHSWAADLAIGVSGEVRPGDGRPPVDHATLDPGGECRWERDQILIKLWCNLPRRLPPVGEYIGKTPSKTTLERTKKKMSACPRLCDLNDCPDWSRNTSDGLVRLPAIQTVQTYELTAGF